MKSQEIRRKSVSELQKLLGERRKQLRDYNFRRASNQLEDVRSMRTTKKDIARILTILNERKNNHY